MIIESLELLNFRNYERECFIFDENTNVLYGDNAQGKTNVLEAIYFARHQDLTAEVKIKK